MGIWIPGGLSDIGGGSGPEIVTWAEGTDEQIVAMVQAHYDGLIDLHDYWAVGDERTVSLSAMSATGVGESHVAQDVVFVLSESGGKYLEDDTECCFQVDQKNVLSNNGSGEEGYMDNASNRSWDACARRTWCNNVYYNAIPETLRPIFKLHKNITGNGGSKQTITSLDYFALRAEKEVFGTNTYAYSNLETDLSQVEWYKTSSNRLKARVQVSAGNTNAYNIYWWLRSPGQGIYTFCFVSPSGNPDAADRTNVKDIAPFGVI